MISRYQLFKVILVTSILVFGVCSKTSIESKNDMNKQSNKIDTFIQMMKEKGEKSNRLINEKSPYLLQHAFNPVDWYPWGEEAFKAAKDQNKPIFLSIGYSTCHWCHVMAHESFENENITEIMNKYFINIKVDREERPDIDGIYMRITQAMTGNGGWPMSLFLTPDRKPIYAGTYFPPKNYYGRPGFPDLLYSIHNAWQQDREKILSSADDITNQLAKLSGNEEEIKIDQVNEALNSYKQIYDSANGGFGPAPKFPQPSILNFALEQGVIQKDSLLLDMVFITLTKMARGGINDQLGGGFHRYSVDEFWRISHFEKMLYDQAQLIKTYSEAWKISKDPLFKETVYSIVEYLNRDMLSPEGGYYSAEDADSPDPENPGHKSEGAFYLWRFDQILGNLGDDKGREFCEYYGIKIKGNAPSDPQGEFRYKNVLYKVENNFDYSKFEKERELLSRIRSKRPRPHLDDKILTDWNALLIDALAKAGAIFNDQEFIDISERLAQFIENNLYSEKGLYHRFRNGNGGIEGNLADYSFLANAFITLYETTQKTIYLEKLKFVLSWMIDRFEDSNNGGFFESDTSDTTLIFKMKDSYDGAIPSANSIAVKALLKYSEITGNDKFKKLGIKALESFGGEIKRAPTGSPYFLSSASKLIRGHEQIVIAADSEVKDFDIILKGIHRIHLSDLAIIFLTSKENRKWFEDQNEQLKDMIAIDGKLTFYYCKNYVCERPVQSVKELIKLIN